MPQNSTDLSVPLNQLNVVHRSDVAGISDEAFHQGEINSQFPLAKEQVDLVHLCRIKFRVLAGERRKPPADTLVATATVSRLYISAPGVDSNYNFRADGNASLDTALINGFLKIADRLTINGEKDANYRMRVNGDTILNGLARIISTLLLDSVGATLYLQTAVDNSVLGLTAQQLRDELNLYTKAHVYNLLAGKRTPGTRTELVFTQGLLATRHTSTSSRDRLESISRRLRCAPTCNNTKSGRKRGND